MLATLARSRMWAPVGKHSVIRNILLTNVPRTATPADIRREISKAGVRGVSEIQLDYEYFRPTGRAFLTLVSSDYLQQCLKSLRNLSISGIPIGSDIHDSPVRNAEKSATHGDLVKAARNGHLFGLGPTAGFRQGESQEILTVSGVPARTTVEDLADILRDFDVKRSSKGDPHIVKLTLPPRTVSLKARFLVTVSSPAEAHRLVRKLHAAHLMMYGEIIQMTAKIIM